MAAKISLIPGLLQKALTVSKNRAYWACQLFGWVTFVVYEIVNQIGLNMFSWPSALLMVSAAVLGTAITHLYRYAIQRWRVLEMPFVRMSLLALLAVFAMSFVLFLALSFVTVALTGDPSNLSFESQYVFMSVLNWSRYLFVWVLIYHLYGLMERVNRGTIERLSYENQLKNVELQNLKAQINPHFLFNALNSVKALTHSDPKRAGDAVMMLSDLLRYSLNYEKQTLVPLSDELAVTRDYLALEKIRFNHRLEYKIEVDAAAERWLAPPILLVTLAENAIKHGIATAVEGGWVRIVARVEEEQLRLQVSNTGFFAPQPDREGIGLANISRRLDMLYSGKAGFTIQNNPDERSVTATVTIPMAQ